MLATVEREIGGRRLLDIGGGAGFFVETALGRGWDAYSFDTSERITALARDRLGPERALGSTEHIPEGSFDLVTLWCVVAHARDAGPIWASAARHAAPGGMLWLTTPNFRFERLKARLGGLRGRPVDFWSADHVGHFMPETIERVLADRGFERARHRFCGITETCMMTGSSRGMSVTAKRAFNALAHRATYVGLPAVASELQITAIRTGKRS